MASIYCKAYNDSPEDDESFRKAQLRTSVCLDKKCCCNCKHLKNANVALHEESNTDRDHWGKGGSWEGGYYLCGHPKVGLVFLGHQTDENLNAKHGLCPLYEFNKGYMKIYGVGSVSDLKPDL